MSIKTIEYYKDITNQKPRRLLWIRRDTISSKIWYIAERNHYNNEWFFFGEITKREAKILNEKDIIKVWHLFLDKNGNVNW